MTRRSISVVSSVHNEAAHVGRMIDSLAAQSCVPDEIVVVDDGSTDGTPDELSDASDRHPGLLRILSQPNGGVSSALNRAIAASSGDIVVIADGDDHYPTHRLGATVDLMSSNAADIVGGQTQLVLGERHLGTSAFATDPAAIEQQIARGLDPLPHTTMALRREAIDRFGGYRQLPRAADLELMLRWGRRGARFAVSPEVLAVHALRDDHFDWATQFRWMTFASYARSLALRDDELDIDTWLAGADLRRIGAESLARASKLRLRRAAISLGLGPDRLSAVLRASRSARRRN